MVAYLIFAGVATLVAYGINRVYDSESLSLWTRWGCSLGAAFLLSVWVQGIYDHPDLVFGLALWLFVPTWAAVEANPKRPRVDADRYAELLAVAPRVRMASADGERVASYLPQLLTLAYHTGRRISAVLALRWSDWRAAEKPYGALFWRAAHDKLGRDWLTPVRPEVRVCLEAFQRERLGLGDALLFPTATDPRRPGEREVGPLGSSW